MTIKDMQETKVVLADYSQIMIPEMPVEVSEEEIRTSIEKAREQAAEKIEKSGKIESGDEVLVDLSGKAGSMSFPPSPIVDYAVEIGAGNFYKEMEEKMIGKKVGDILQCVINMPVGMLPEECGSQALEVTVKIKKVFEYRLPDLNDEFASRVSPCSTLKEFREYVREQCRRQKENAKIPLKQNKALSYMIKNSVVDIKEEFVEEKARELKDAFAMQLKNANCTFEQYLNHTKMTEEAYEQRAKRDAKNILSGSCILYHLAEKESLKAPEEAVNAEIARLDPTGMVSAEELRSRLSDADMEKIIFTVKLQVASMLLVSRVCEEG